MPPQIAIIGAGPGGCMLARLLHTSGAEIHATVFEAEASIDYRSQGGTLDLRTATGLAAIKQAGLWDEFQRFARYDGESLLVTDKNLTTWLRRRGRRYGELESQKYGEAPEIDRADLRKMLMESLSEGTVKWGYKLSSIEEAPSGLALRFANGEVHTGYDLIVGCDGAFSKTRAWLSSERPHYSGLGGWNLNIPFASETAPQVSKLVAGGSVFAYSDHKALSLQQLSRNDSISVSYYAHFPEDYTRTCGFDTTNIDLAKAALRTELPDWKEELLEAVESARGECTWRNLYELPVGFQWDHKPGVTLLGDAAHVMTPFAGIGVNTALLDALELSRQIIAFTTTSPTQSNQLTPHDNNVKLGSLDGYICTYEKAMFAYALVAQRLTEGSKTDMLFTPGAPRTSIESWVLRHATPNLPRWSHGILGVVVRVGFWLYKRFV